MAPQLQRPEVLLTARTRPARPRRPRGRLPVALTGTPGVGKSAVARALSPGLACVEVGALAKALGAGRGSGRTVEVDVPRLAARLRRPRAWGGVDVVVGHLAHLLPVRAVVLLRCRPPELAKRLRRARRGTEAERTANVVCEATDVVRWELARSRRPCLEIDTTERTPRAVARELARWLERPVRTRRPAVDWLADPAVTAYLLAHAA